jgi:uncharacterized RDD family membrane protein YckC
MKTLVIGRNPTANTGEIPIRIEDRSNSISRTHCKITQYDDGRWLIEDSGSKNGTFTNGEKITEPRWINADEQVILAGKIPIYISDLISKNQNPNPNSPKEQRFSESNFSNDLQYASFAHRLAAWFIDGLIISIPVYIFIFFISFIIGFGSRFVFFIQFAVIFLVVHYYFGIPISKNGSTIGRKMMGIKYLDLDTMDYPSVGKVWLRLISYIFSGSIFMLGFLIMLFNEKHQALHDLIAKTIVVKSN